MEQTLDQTQQEVSQEVSQNDLGTANPDALGVTSEQITFAVTKDLKNPKAALGFAEYTEGKGATWKAANPDEGKEKEIEILQLITVSYPVAHSFAGIQEVMGTEEDEAVSIYNTGAFNKLKAQARAYFTQTTEAGDLSHSDETSWDYDQSKDIIATPLKRRNLTDTQKAVRDLKGYSAETLQEALRQMGLL